MAYSASTSINQRWAHMEAIWVVNVAVGGMAYGALVTLGIVSLTMLHSTRTRDLKQSRGLRNQERYLYSHIVLILMINTFLQIWDIRRFIKAIFFTELDSLTFFHDWSNIFIVLTGALTDGLLVSFFSFHDSFHYESFRDRSGAVI